MGIDRMKSWARAVEWAQSVNADGEQLRNAVAIALRNAQQPNQRTAPPQFQQARKEAEALLRRMDMTEMRQRVAIAAHMAGISSEQFREAVHYLAWASEALAHGVQCGTQGRTPFTRFVRALDVSMGVYSIPALPAAIAADLFSELTPDDPRTERDVEALRARPYIDELGLETGEIVPDPQPLK